MGQAMLAIGLVCYGFVERVGRAGQPHGEKKASAQGLDIVIDQILTGSGGVAAVEAAAASRVVGSLAREVLTNVRAPSVEPATVLRGGASGAGASQRMRDLGVQNGVHFRCHHEGRERAPAMDKLLKGEP